MGGRTWLTPSPLEDLDTRYINDDNGTFPMIPEVSEYEELLSIYRRLVHLLDRQTQCNITKKRYVRMSSAREAVRRDGTEQCRNCCRLQQNTNRPSLETSFGCYAQVC